MGSQEVIATQANMLKNQMQTIQELEVALGERQDMQETTDKIHASLEDVKNQLKLIRKGGGLKKKPKKAEAAGATTLIATPVAFGNNVVSLPKAAMQQGEVAEEDKRPA